MGSSYFTNVGKTIVKKTAYSLIKLALAVNKSLIDSQKPLIGEEKSAIDDKKSAVDRIKSAIEQQRYNGTLKAYIFKEYDEIEKNEYSKVSLNEVSRDLRLSETL